MEQYYPPILFVLSEDSARSALTERVQAEYHGVVYSEPSANSALHAMSHLYDVGIVVAEDNAFLPSGKHILTAIKTMYPDCRRVILAINDTPADMLAEMLVNRRAIMTHL
jgi:DNA-binding NarL/FixJ family response regulator